MWRKHKVAILSGGPSSEHEVSLKSGENVFRHIPEDKYVPRRIFIDRGGKWEIEPCDLKKHFDVAFIAMHGEYGEDGTVQKILESERMPYTGSDAKTSALGMNKFLSLRLLSDHGFEVPPTVHLTKNEWFTRPRHALHAITGHLEKPWIAKPNNRGSSVGVHVIKTQSGLEEKLDEVFKEYRDLIVEPYINGKELTCGVLDHGFPESAYALPPTEIIPKTAEFFDYDAKYTPNASLEITPARLSDLFIREIQKIAIAAHKALHCKGFSRTDMILGKDKKIYVLEVNTIPGLTETSLLPKAAEAHGISFSSLLDRIVQAAVHKI